MDHVLNAVTPKQRLMEQLTPRPLDTNNPTEAVVLPPDHPLMQKFQKALKEHLLKINAQLVEEIADIDNKISKLYGERDTIGSLLYQHQQEVDHQKEILDDYNRRLVDVNKKRMQDEKEAASLKSDYDTKNSDYKDIKRKYNEGLMQLAHAKNLEHKFLKWNKEIEDEMEAAKRVVSKDHQDQKAVTEKKRQIDFFLFNLDSEVRAREQELASIVDQYKDQTDHFNELKQKLANSNADLEALQQDQKRLFTAWNEVILSIEKKDTFLAKQRDDLTEINEKNKVFQSNIEGTRKNSAKEMELNEKLEHIRNRINHELQILENKLEKQNEDHNRFSAKIDHINAVLEISENDLTKAKIEGQLLENQTRSVRKKIEKLSKEKMTFEENTLEILQQQLSNDQASIAGAKKLRSIQDERRKMEVTLLNTEHHLHEILFESEKWKAKVSKLKEDLDKLLRSKDKEAERLKQLMYESDLLKRDILMKLRKVDILNKDLQDKVIAADSQELSPQELRILHLERDIAEIYVDIRKNQKYWLQQQDRIIQLSERRSRQLGTLHLARAQLLVIEQKTLKIDDELNSLLKQDMDTVRDLKTLTLQIDQLTIKLNATKKNQQIEGDACEFRERSIFEKLKDAEISALNLERNISELGQTIAESKRTVLEKHHEALSWETKWKMAEEARKYRESEHSAASGMAAMHAEIHRMEVRYQQLKRAQEKLAQDLENCVAHRDHIFDSANVRSKMPDSKAKSRFTNLHRLNELKNKLRHVHAERMIIEKNLIGVRVQNEECMEELKKMNENIDEEKTQELLIQQEIENAILMKQENLDSILRIQNRAKRYRTLVSGKQQLKCRSETAVTNEMQRQQEINNHLASVLESLLTEFPDHSFSIRRVIQTLKMDEE